MNTAAATSRNADLSYGVDRRIVVQFPAGTRYFHIKGVTIDGVSIDEWIY
jgi:hypothetical protein